jgi:zinc protease
MRTLLGLLAVCLLSACAAAHEAPTAGANASAPSAESAPPVAAAGPAAAAAPEAASDMDVTVGNVGQVQVLVQRMPGAELVTALLAIRGGVQNLDAHTAGVEMLGLRTAAAGGTEQLDKDAFSRKLSKLGGTLNSSAGPNYSTLQAKSLVGVWQQTFDLLADVFLHPGLPNAELELQREQQLQELKQERETPDGALRVLGNRMLFAGTPYANRPIGSEDSVKALSAEQVRTHLATLRTQTKLLLVVVGDVDAKVVLAKARQAFGALPVGDATPLPPPNSTFTQPRIEVDARTLPTNYVLAQYAGPSWQSKELPTGRLVASILGQREFLEVRTKRNLSYAAGAFFDATRPQAFGFLYVTAVDPGAALPVMQDVVKDLGQKPVSSKELAGYRSTFLTGFLQNQATTDGAAQRLVAAQLLGGDWRLARTLPERVRQVTAQDVQAYTQKYVRDYQVAVVGDPKKVDLSMLH